MRDLPLAGDEFAGYRLFAVLGRGGTSTVYRAENPRVGNVIALKVMASELAGDDVFRARFLEESRIAAGLNHPNVIPIYDWGSSDGLLYIAMRAVTGTDLRQMLKKRGRLRMETAVFLLSQAARGLDAAHRRGLVHRDVRPGNLLVEQASDDADPDHLYLTDFGITKYPGEHTGLTATGEFIGTVDYIAPEQARDRSVTGLADQYSLGCVLYECLTGRVPFEEEPARPTMLRPDLPRAVDEVFTRVLAKQPGDRYGNCREFMAAAREALGSLPEPPGPGRDQYYAGSPVGVGEHPSYRAGPQEGHPAEITHQWADVHGDPAESVAGMADRASPRRTARWLVLSAAVVLALAAGLGVALVKVASGGTSSLTLSGDGSNASPSVSTRPSASPTLSTSPAPAPSTSMGVEAGTGESGPGTLAGVLAAADNSVEGKGLIPPAKCGQYQQNAAGQIVCLAPVPGVTEVYYQNYSSLPALYTAYEQEVALLDGGAFRQNTGHCGDGAVSYAEFGWNQEEGHPHDVTVAQMAAGTVGQIYAAGRMACFATRTAHGVSQDLVWTIDNGPALGVAIGSGSPRAVYQLWASLHHAVLFRGTEMCGTAGRMNFNDIPTGNLKVVPVCPAGVQAVPASPSA
jgi:Protein kinase domain